MSRKGEEWTCFYCEIVGKESREKVTNDHENFKSQVKNHVEEIESKSKLKITKHNLIEAKSSPQSTDHMWSTNDEVLSVLIV